MKAFADLVERLLFTESRDAKIALLRRYFTSTPDPDRGFALAIIAGTVTFPAAGAGLIRDLAARTDPELFAWSHDFVGDLAETVALMWPVTVTGEGPGLADVMHTLTMRPKPELPDIVASWLDAADPSTRLVLLKLITGKLRVSVTAGLARWALATLSGGSITMDAIEEIWHSLKPPYLPLFAWLEGRGSRPDPTHAPVFRPMMLAHPLEDGDIAPLESALYRAEWKWDGLRVQLAATGGGRSLYSRDAEDISAAFPEIIATMNFTAVLDGELLVVRDGQAAPFGDLRQRLTRKTVSPKMLREHPAGVRLFDILFDGTEDLRGLDFDTRRERLAAWFDRTRPARMELSPLIAFRTLDDLAGILRMGPRDAAIEGLILKRAASPYLPGRPKGHWWKWKRAPLTIDAVLMYAQRGQGRASGSYADYTFGVWRDDGALVPLGKSCSGITDLERGFLDRWIRDNTVARFGPVSEVAPGVVLEIAVDAVQRSSRHKSGVTLRLPRIVRVRADKPVAKADRLETVMRLIV